MARHCSSFVFAPFSTALHRRPPRRCPAIATTCSYSASSVGDAALTFSSISRGTADTGTDLRDPTAPKSVWGRLLELAKRDTREAVEDVPQAPERCLIPAVVRRELLELEDVFIEALIRRAQYAQHGMRGNDLLQDTPDTWLVDSYFERILPALCEADGTRQRDGAAQADGACLQALQSTVHLGAAMADAKLNSRRSMYATLMKESKRDALFKMLHYEEDEQHLLDRVDDKARSMDINAVGGDSSDAYLVAPSVIAGIYKDSIIPLLNQAIAQSIASRWVRKRTPPSSW